MIRTQIPGINPDKYSRFEERKGITDHGNNPGLIHKTDKALQETIYFAFWKDDVLRELGYHELGVYVTTPHAQGRGLLRSFTDAV